MFYRSWLILFILTIALSVRLRFTASEYIFVIFTLFFDKCVSDMTAISLTVRAILILYFNALSFLKFHINLNKILKCYLLLPRCACAAWLAYPKRLNACSHVHSFIHSFSYWLASSEHHSVRFQCL